MLKRTIYSWGNGLKAQLGHGQLGSFKQPKLISPFKDSNVLAIGAGVTHSVALIQEDDMNHVYIFGDNFYGQAGRSTLTAGLIPEFIGGLFESDDDEFLSPCRLEEGFEGNMTSISVGDFHSLSLRDDGKVYAWGAGILGNGTLMYSARPVLLPIENIKSVKVRGNTSMAIGEDIYMWGHLGGKKALTPIKVKCPVDTSSIKDIDINSDYIVFSTGDNLVLMGNGNDYQQPFYPFNPPLLSDLAEIDTLDLPILFNKPFPGTKLVQIHGSTVFVLTDEGRLYSVDKKGTKTEILIKRNDQPIRNMHIGQNNAIFATTSHVFVFHGVAPIPPQPKTTSILYKWLTKNDERPVVDPVSIVDAILHGTPETFPLETKLVSCCWDHCLAK